MSVLFVSATNTDVGKTYTTIKLIETFSKLGVKVGVMKPIETGVTTVPLDAKRLLETVQKYNPDFKHFSTDDICPFQYTIPAAPYVAKGDTPIDWVRFDMHIAYLKKACDLLIIEGAGGLMVPIEGDMLMIDLAEKYADALLLVVSSRLGSINDTLLSRNLLDQKTVPYEWMVNLYEHKEDFFEITAPYYDKALGGYRLVDRDMLSYAQQLKATLLVR